jgi:uncharacterized protein YciI
VKQYLVIAHDGDDAEALPRRMAERPHHLAGAGKLKANGNLVVGGATLNEQGLMNGSVMIVQFETDEDFETWYRNEPYITGGVWQSVEVKPFRVADVP